MPNKDLKQQHLGATDSGYPAQTLPPWLCAVEGRARATLEALNESEESESGVQLWCTTDCANCG